METNEQETLNSENEAEVAESAQAEEAKPEVNEELEAIRKENATLKAQKDHWKKKATENVAKVEEKKEEQLTAKDALAFVEAKVSSEDYDEVIRIAKVLNLPPREALKDKTAQAILSARAEERRTAEATQTGKSQRGASKTTGESLLERAQSTGEVPEDEEGMQKLFMAKLARKLKK